MNKCYECAAELPETAQLCPYCGVAVVPGVAAEAVPVGAGVPAGPGEPGAAPPVAARPAVQAPAVQAPAASWPAGQGPATGPALQTPTVSAAQATLRGPGGRKLLIIAVAVALLIGGGVGYLVLRPAPPSGATSVKQYFDDLGRGDTAAALKLVADAANYQSPQYPLLTPKALASKANRPSRLKILQTTSLPAGIGGLTTERVQVSYQLTGATVTQTIEAAPPATKGGPYLLRDPFLVVGVESIGGRSLSINGVAVPANDDPIEVMAFPGAYTATAAGNALLAGATATANVRPSMLGPTVAAIDFPQPALAPGAQAAIEAEVKQVLDGCAHSMDPEPGNCPFGTYVFGSDVVTHWTITTYPDLNINLQWFGGADGPVEIQGVTDGVAHYDVTYTDFTGAPATDSGDVRFPIYGTAAAAGSGITVNLS